MHYSMIFSMPRNFASHLYNCLSQRYVVIIYMHYDYLIMFVWPQRRAKELLVPNRRWDDMYIMPCFWEIHLVITHSSGSPHLRGSTQPLTFYIPTPFTPYILHPHSPHPLHFTYTLSPLLPTWKQHPTLLPVVTIFIIIICGDDLWWRSSSSK